MTDPHSPLRLNVGFIVAQQAGFSREFTFELAKTHLPPDLYLTGLAGTSQVTRTPQGLLLQVEAHATLNLDCVRCLNTISQTLKVNFTELYAFSQRNITDSGLLVPEDGHIDLTPLMREYLLLEVPIRPLCREDCKGLCPICGGDLNETLCHHDEDPGDPRLAALKSLLDK